MIDKDEDLETWFQQNITDAELKNGTKLTLSNTVNGLINLKKRKESEKPNPKNWKT